MRWDNSIDTPPNDRMRWFEIETIGNTKNVDNEAFENATIEKIAVEGAYNLSCVVTKIIEVDNGFVVRVADGTKARIKSKVEDGGQSINLRAHSKNKYYVDVYVEDTDLLDRIVQINLSKGTFLHLGGLWCGRKEGDEDQFQFVLQDGSDTKATIEVMLEGDERVKRIWERMEVESCSEESSQVNESLSLPTTHVPSDFDVDTDYVKLFVEELNKNLANLDTQVVSSQSSVMSEGEKGDYEGAVVPSLPNQTQVRQCEDDETSELYFIRMKKWQEGVKSSSSYDNQTVHGGSFVDRESEDIGNEVIARQSSVRSSCSAKETTFQYEVENCLKKGSFEGLTHIEMASEQDEKSTSISKSQSHFMKANQNEENLSYQTYFVQTKKIQERYRSQVKSCTEVLEQGGFWTLQVEQMQISNNNHGVTTAEKQRLKTIHPKRKRSTNVETNLNQLNTDESLTLKRRIKHIIPVEKVKKSKIRNDNLEIDSRQTEVVDLPVYDENTTESLPNFLEVQGGHFEALGSISAQQINNVESHTSRENKYFTENAFGSEVCTESLADIEAMGEEAVTNALGGEACTDLASEAVWTDDAGDDVLIDGVVNSLKHPRLSYNHSYVGFQNSSYSSNRLKLGRSQKHNVGKKRGLLKRRSNRNKSSLLASPDCVPEVLASPHCLPELTSNIPTLEETTPSTHFPLHLLTGGGGLVYNHLSDSKEEDMLLLPSDAEKEDMLLLPSDDENIVSNDDSPNISQNSGRIVTFSNESSKLTLEDLVACCSGTHKLDAFVEAVYSELRGSYSELSPSNILFGRCLTCGKFDPLYTFPVDFQGVGYACCFRGGLTEVLRVFNVVLKLYDDTRGLFVRVTNQHVEELVGCGPAKFQRLDGLQRLELVERMRGRQGCPVELVVTVLKTECGLERELHVVQSKVLENP